MYGWRYSGLDVSVWHVLPRHLALVALCACAPVTESQDVACPDTIKVVFRSPSLSLKIGDTVTPSIRVYECAGAREVTVATRWRALDTTIVRVDSLSGKVTGLLAGETYVIAKSAAYGYMGDIPATVSKD